MQSSHASTRYRIVVKGRLSKRFLSAFGDLGVETRSPRDGGPTETAISGAFVDQAHLYGVLNRLRDLGIDLVSVDAID
jgi:hypothetical protein